MHYNQFKKPNKPFLCLILFLLLLMNISVTQAEEYNFITKWGSFGSAQPGSTSGVSVDSSGNVYVTDGNNNCIQKFDSNGNFITKWGSEGSGDGQFGYPNGVAVDSSGNVYVADSYNNRIQKFDSNGNFITKWGSPGSGDGQFGYPNGVAVDSSGNVYVTDRNNHRIQKFDSNGNYMIQWGSYRSGDEHFYPEGVAIDSSGNVYVTDYYHIQKFDSNGNFITIWGTIVASGGGLFYSPNDVAIDSSGSVYVAEDHLIQKFDSNGNFITIWGSVSCSGDGQFTYPNGVAIDSSGNVYVADTDENRIEKFDSDGNFITKWGYFGIGDGQFSKPYGVAVDSSGNVYVADSNNKRIQKFDSNGNFITKWGSSGSGDGQFNFITDVAVDSSGNVYVVDLNNRIQKFDSNGNFITKWGSSGSGDGQFNYPNGVAVDSSGNVYVADGHNDRIQKFDGNGNFIAKWGSPGSGDGQFSDQNGVAVDSSSNVYVADSGNKRIQKFDSNGNFITKWGSSGSDDGQFDSPNGVAVDSSGNVYVADSWNNRIQKFYTEFLSRPVIANFSTNVNNGYAPLSVQFTDLSENATVWNWDFGDGATSYEQNPMHPYLTAGNYTVNLTVSNVNGTNSTFSYITVLELQTPSPADFSTNVTSGYVPMSVQFTDLSENATEWNWDFGDGATSTEQNPVHTYYEAGDYTINLTVSNVNGTDSKTAMINVSASQSGRLGGPDNFNYTFKDSNIIGGPTYDWIEISGTGTQVLSSTDDAVQDNVDLGFFFNYYGTNYSRLAISSNGLLFYSGATNQYMNEPIGQSPGVHGFIAPFWDDLVTLNNEGKVYYQTLGTSPNRIFVTEWVDNKHIGISGQGITFESILYEGSNDIKFQYKDMDFGNGSYDTSFDKGGSATVGIESPDGTGGLQYSFNEKVIDSGKTILFKYPQDSGIIPVVNFYNNVTSGVAPLTVQFNDSSENATAWYWDFGDGATSNEQNPMHTYTTAGAYTITLTVSNANGGINSKSAMVTVQDVVGPIYNPENGHYYALITMPEGINWEDAKNAAQSLSYNGMNGHLATITSQDENDFIVNNFDSTEHWLGGSQPDGSVEPDGGWQWITGEPWVYNNWNYGEPNNVNEGEDKLHFNGNEYWNDLSHNNLQRGYIVEYEETLRPHVANFSTNVTIGNVPLSVQFTDISENAIEWSWDFNNDGVVDSNAQNPTYTYSTPGNYTVTLTVSNSAGSDVITKRDYIIASKPDAIIWGVAPLTLQFTDQSENATSWKWYFGDGTNSTEKNPAHTYTKAGQYAVAVTVTNAAGSNTATYIGYINVVNSLEPPVATFSASSTYGKLPLNVSFTDKSTGSPTSWKWYFGDGTNSTEQNPTHIYNKTGQYSVTLTASNVAGSNAITKLKYISVGNSLKAPVTSFSVSVIS